MSSHPDRPFPPAPEHSADRQRARSRSTRLRGNRYSRRYFILGSAVGVAGGLATVFAATSSSSSSQAAETAALATAPESSVAAEPVVAAEAAPASVPPAPAPAEAAPASAAPAEPEPPAEPAKPAEPEPAPTEAPAANEAPEATTGPASRRIAAAGDSRVIVLDPGHGGTESGATRGSVKEKDLTLLTALKTAEILREDGWTVVLTRTTDRNVHPGRDITGDGRVSVSDDLQARIDIANEHQAAAFVSIHYNAAANNQGGTETFYNPQRPHADESRRLATAIHEELLAALRSVGHQPRDRGVRQDTELLKGGTFYLLGDRSYIARPSKMPAALGEGLFLTNDEEFALIQRPETIDALALAYAIGIERYLKG